MAPLSIQNLSSVAWQNAPRSAHIASAIACRRLLHPTPPTRSSESAPVWLIARSAVSTSIAKQVSCRVRQTSASVYSSSSDALASLARHASGGGNGALRSYVRFARVLRLSALVSRPEKETSMPLTAYGKSKSLFPERAQFSTCRPGAGSLGRCKARATRSRAFPMAMSIVSPNIWYLPLLYAMTCVLPPLTYSTAGSRALVMSLPISMCATQWLTSTSGTRHSKLSVRATTAHATSGPPMPGPFVYATAATRRFPLSSHACESSDASARASDTSSRMTARWC
mmetsp:Transcript_4759/g.12406  ORF Transcript_4759/g.12406 Transcript_4759/m.12406 type:complete len:283 (+) Transcript_4759:266-1114(+)